MYGDQDLLNLIIGRRDIDVRYLHPRFNVQLAYPARQKDAFMDPPWCGYGQAQFAAAAAGGALNSSSFGHFIWTRKPWTAQVDSELRHIYGSLERGGRTGMQYIGSLCRRDLGGNCSAARRCKAFVSDCGACDTVCVEFLPASGAR